MFLRNGYDHDGVFEIPKIRKQNIDLETVQLIGYDKVKQADKSNQNSIVHFFLDDYKFESLRNSPESKLEKLSQYRGVLSPQFSTYYTMPIAMQIYNTFRSRWCGAYLQSKGLSVIPTVYWGMPQSFCYCEPFAEMTGNIIHVDYATTNHLAPNTKNVYIKHTNGVFPLEFNTSPCDTTIRDGVYVKKVSGCTIITGYGGGGGGSSRMGRSRGNTPRSNQAQNKQFRDLAKKLGLTKDQQRQLHDAISHQGMSYQEILNFAQDIFGK